MFPQPVDVMPERTREQVAFDWLLGRFDRGEVGFGSIIRHDELETTLGLVPRHLLHNAAYEEVNAQRMDYMRAISGLKVLLLTEAQLALRSVLAIGYEIVKPDEQARWAYNSAIEEVRRSLDTARLRVTNVRVDELTPAQRREQTDLAVKLSQVRSMVPWRRVSPLDPGGEEEGDMG